MNKVNKLYWKLMSIGSTRIRNLCSLGLFDEVRAEAEHLHQIPQLIDEGVPYQHQFYLDTHCNRFLITMEEIASEASMGQINTIYKPLWSQLRSALHDHFGSGMESM